MLLVGCTASVRTGGNNLSAEQPPLEPEPNAAAADQPPMTDEDGDGLVPPMDKCPKQAETKNGYQDADGCPNKTPSVYLGEHEIVHAEKIKFGKGSATIDHVSDKLIEKISQVILAHPEIDFVEVAGHTDSDGSAERNLVLSRKRSRAVIEQLVQDGVARNRLGSAGYGFFCPHMEGHSKEAKRHNRRVDFVILRRAGKDIPPGWDGCPEAARKHLRPLQIPPDAPKGT